MKTCPHCGADLRDTARFCPSCMTVLNEKRVIPTPTYTLRRWLPAAVAVLVLAAAVSVVRGCLPDTPSPLSSAVVPSAVSTASSTHATTSPSASATTGATTAGQPPLSTSTSTSTSASASVILPTAGTAAAPSTTTGTLPLGTTSASTGTTTASTSTTMSTSTSTSTSTTTTTTVTTTTIGPFDEKRHPSPYVEPLIGMRFYATPLQDEPYRDEVQEYCLTLCDFYFFTYGDRTNMFVQVGLEHPSSDYAPRYARIELNCYDENDELVTKFTILADEARPGVIKYYKWPFEYALYQRIARMELATDNYPEGYTIQEFYRYYP